MRTSMLWRQIELGGSEFVAMTFASLYGPVLRHMAGMIILSNQSIMLKLDW